MVKELCPWSDIGCRRFRILQPACLPGLSPTSGSFNDHSKSRRKSSLFDNIDTEYPSDRLPKCMISKQTACLLDLGIFPGFAAYEVMRN